MIDTSDLYAEKVRRAKHQLDRLTAARQHLTTLAKSAVTRLNADSPFMFAGTLVDLAVTFATVAKDCNEGLHEGMKDPSIWNHMEHASAVWPADPADPESVAMEGRQCPCGQTIWREIGIEGEMFAEYDIRGGQRGKYVARYTDVDKPQTQDEGVLQPTAPVTIIDIAELRRLYAATVAVDPTVTTQAFLWKAGNTLIPLCDEVERLRAALTEVIDYGDAVSVALARAALDSRITGTSPQQMLAESLAAVDAERESEPQTRGHRTMTTEEIRAKLNVRPEVCPLLEDLLFAGFAGETLVAVEKLAALVEIVAEVQGRSAEGLYFATQLRRASRWPTMQVEAIMHKIELSGLFRMQEHYPSPQER